MASSSVRDLVQKLRADAGLRERLRRDPEGVFKEYDLTAEEKAAVLSVGARYGFETPSGTAWQAASQNWFPEAGLLRQG